MSARLADHALALRGLLIGLACWLVLAVPAAAAVKSIKVTAEVERIEVTPLAEIYEGRSDKLQVETAPGADGLAGRITVQAAAPGSTPNWIVFSLTNSTDKPMERWLAADRYSIIGSGISFPDLDQLRIVAITPSLGFLPERIANDRSDIFRLTLDPGQTITYAAEVKGERIPHLFLWRPLDHELKSGERQLLNGALLGITGLIGIFLIALFGANHKAIFPASALVACSVLVYLSADFGFFHKLFQLPADDNAVYRATGEAAVAASLVIFLTTFLRISSWHGFIRMLFTVWIIAQIALVAVALIDPKLAATFARVSFAVIVVAGGLVTAFLAARGQDRALALLPTWILLAVFVFSAAMTLTGRLQGELVPASLASGLVVLLLVLSFTVTQFAFRTLEPLYGASPSDQKLRSLAVDGSGAGVFEWAARRDEIKVSPIVDQALGLAPGTLSCKVDDFIKHLYGADRERLRMQLRALQQKGEGTLTMDVRLRHVDGTHRWFEIDGSSVPSGDRRSMRFVGLMHDVTDEKRSRERLLHDAVYDSLTGLPQRSLLIDRLAVALHQAATRPGPRPALISIDLSRRRDVANARGIVVGETLLLTAARRLARQLEPFDTLARMGSDQFAILVASPPDEAGLIQLAERMRRSVEAPIRIADKDLELRAAIGLTVAHDTGTDAESLIRDAEIAMFRAKRSERDEIEIGRPDAEARALGKSTASVADLRRAIRERSLRFSFQPVIALIRKELVGFEMIVDFDLAGSGFVNPFKVEIADDDPAVRAEVAEYVLAAAADSVQRWQRELARADAPLFVAVDISFPELFRQDVIERLSNVVAASPVARGSLRLEIEEGQAMEGPEESVEMMRRLKAAGADITLTDVGLGYSSVTYLRRFPADVFKLDRTLIEAAANGGEAEPIARSIAAMARELGRHVSADGVEVDSDVGFLRALGADFAQGAFFGEPMGDREALRFTKAVRKAERKMRRRGFIRTLQTPRPAEPTPEPPRVAAASPEPPATSPRPAAAAAAPPPSASRPGPQGNGAAPGWQIAGQPLRSRPWAHGQPQIPEPAHTQTAATGPSTASTLPPAYQQPLPPSPLSPAFPPAAAPLPASASAEPPRTAPSTAPAAPPSPLPTTTRPAVAGAIRRGLSLISAARETRVSPATPARPRAPDPATAHGKSVPGSNPPAPVPDARSTGANLLALFSSGAAASRSKPEAPVAATAPPAPPAQPDPAPAPEPRARTTPPPLVSAITPAPAPTARAEIPRTLPSSIADSLNRLATSGPRTQPTRPKPPAEPQSASDELELKKVRVLPPKLKA